MMISRIQCALCSRNIMDIWVLIKLTCALRGGGGGCQMAGWAEFGWAKMT